MIDFLTEGLILGDSASSVVIRYLFIFLLAFEDIRTLDHIEADSTSKVLLNLHTGIVSNFI